MFASHFCRRTRQAALASALVLALGGTAYAEPGQQFGHHGPGARAAHVEGVIAQLRTQLNLNTQQQVAFDNALAASKAAREGARAELAKVHAAMQAELAKTAPDLRKVSDLGEQVRASLQAQHRQIRDQWLALYDTFDAQQKLVVRDALAKRAERIGQFREKMRDRFGG
jgi:hypothetical protein